MLPKRNYYLNDYFDIFNMPYTKEKEYMKTDEYVEEAAREKLGLVKDNEIVFQEEK